jgi:urease accessory protein UreF
MLDRTDSAAQVTLDCLEGIYCLPERVGVAADFSCRTNEACSFFQSVGDMEALRRFLETYHSQMLISHELPIICNAYRHASRNEIRELIFLDLELTREPSFQPFAKASRVVGSTQLRRLRPLRDQRLVQRYLHAVENGEASGWHTVVYGLVLALYSLPLRQGLLNYGHEAMRGFIASANSSLKLIEEQCQQLHHEICLRLPKAVESVLTKHPVTAA